MCNREGRAYTPSDPRDPCKVCELQRKYGEEGYYNKREKWRWQLEHHSSRERRGPHWPLWSSSRTIIGKISQDLLPLESATCSTGA